MDENTTMAIVLSALFGAIGLAAIAYWIAWAVVERAKERTKQLKLEHDAHPPQSVEMLRQSDDWPEYTVTRTTLPREEGQG